MDRSRWAIPANLALYQVSWFSCVLGAAHGLPWAGPVVTAVVVMIHLTLTGRPAAELRLIAAAVAVGVIVDGTLAVTGAVRYPGGMPAPFVPPAWMLGLWAGFAILLPHALAWLRGRLLLGAALGALGGPLAYLGGERLGAIDLPGGALPLLPLAALALAWAAAIPLLLWLSERLVPEEPARPPEEGTRPSATTGGHGALGDGDGRAQGPRRRRREGTRPSPTPRATDVGPGMGGHKALPYAEGDRCRAGDGRARGPRRRRGRPV